MRSFAGKENQTECTLLQGENVFLKHTELPDPKQVYRRACREISAAGKFEEGYLKVHDVLAWQLHRLIFEAI